MDEPTNAPDARLDLDGVGPAAAPPERPAPPVEKSGLAFFATVLALFAVLGTLAQAASPVLGLVWSELGALLLPAAVAAAGSNLRPGRALLLATRPPPRSLGLAALVGVAGFFAAGSVMALTSLVLPARWVELFDMSKLFARPPLERAALSLAAASLAPLCEEAAFRGWLLTALRTRHRPSAAIALCGLFFAIMHLDPVRFVALLGLGALYGWLAWRAGSLWPAVVAHAVNNTLGVTIATVTGAGRPGATVVRGLEPRPLQVAAAAALALFLAGSVLRAFAAAYQRATPSPPPVEQALTRRDPADTSTSFDLGRVPRWMVGAMAAALLALAALAVRAATR